MTDAATTIAAIRRSIELLVDLNDGDATRTAAALNLWLTGTNFERAAGLVPGWRSNLRLHARDRALAELLKIHADMNPSELAAWIVAGLERVAGLRDSVRPSGADGYLTDLARADRNPGKRQWHRLITEARLTLRSLNGKGDSVTVNETGG
jgi:hypothetical protein